jgi:hypothetical protein
LLLVATVALLATVWTLALTSLSGTPRDVGAGMLVVLLFGGAHFVAFFADLFAAAVAVLALVTSAHERTFAGYLTAAASSLLAIGTLGCLGLLAGW